VSRPALVLVHGGQHTSRCWEPAVDELARQAPDVRVLAVDLPGRTGAPAGLTVPGVVAQLGAGRVRRLVLVAACVPPDGGTVLDTLSGPLRSYVARAVRRGRPSPPMPRPLAAWAFCNGMTRSQRRFALDGLCAEATGPTGERVDRSALPGSVPRSWVLTGRDRSLRPLQQRRSIEDLGGVEEVVELDACHDVMISHPAELAAVLAARAV
jgi:pimeloyl-ACP methyl ester carboxylesterase